METSSSTYYLSSLLTVLCRKRSLAQIRLGRTGVADVDPPLAGSLAEGDPERLHIWPLMCKNSLQYSEIELMGFVCFDLCNNSLPTCVGIWVIARLVINTRAGGDW